MKCLNIAIFLFLLISIGIENIYCNSDDSGQNEPETIEKVEDTEVKVPSQVVNENINNFEQKNNEQSSRFEQFSQEFEKYIKIGAEYTKISLIKFHNILTESLNIQYPYDLLIFFLVGYAISRFLTLLCSKKVGYFLLT